MRLANLRGPPQREVFERCSLSTGIGFLSAAFSQKGAVHLAAVEAGVVLAGNVLDQRRVQSLTRDRTEAEDLVQETYAKELHARAT